MAQSTLTTCQQPSSSDYSDRHGPTGTSHSVLRCDNAAFFTSVGFNSHEVFVDEEQMEWFEQELAAHPAEEGWKVLVFSHAPPMGSGLRVVQGVHIRNQCAWINHRLDKEL